MSLLAVDVASVKVVVGCILLAICAGVGGAFAVLDAEWRLAERRRRRYRDRVKDVDLTGARW